MRKSQAVIVLAVVLGSALAVRAQESALDVYLREHPRAMEEGGMGPLEARALQALTPEQAEAWALGEYPSQILLESGESLANLLATLLAGGTGLAYVPLDACTVFRTFGTPAGPFAADESRQYFIRGTDLSAQGGSATGCMVPAEAVAAVLHFRAVLLTQGVPGRLRVKRVDGVPLAQVAIEHLRQGEVGRRTAGSSVVGLCEGTCATGEIEVTSEGVAADLYGAVVGYFRPVVAADVPEAGNADTLDGFDGSAFALAVHTHDGGDIVSGTVGEPFIDPLIARDSEIMPIVLDNDGPSSTLDADLLDGKDSLELMLQVDNCLTVSPSCPAAAADALAARCWQTISAALAEIGVGLPAASAGNRYLVKVGPGTYAEQVAMVPFVDIEGAGEKLTKITQAGFVGTPSGTVLGASDAELRYLSVDNSGGGDFAVAIYNDDVSPKLKHVTAYATVSTTVSAAIFNDGTGLASPTLTHVTAFASLDAVLNEDSSVTVRDSILGDPTMGLTGINNTSTGVGSSASVVNTNLNKPATDSTAGSTFTCLGAYDATFTELDANCQP